MGKWFARASDEGGCVSFLFILLPVAVPLLAAPVTLFLGFLKTMAAVFGIAVLMMLSPFVYFGIKGLYQGVPLADVFASLSVTVRPMAIIAGYMVGWSAICAGVAAVVVWCWQRWRTA